MKNGMRATVLAVIGAISPIPASAFGGYWTYTYKDIQVVASDQDRQAKEVAHHLHRLDLALQALLGLRSEEDRVPTRIYMVPFDRFQMLTSKSVEPRTSSPS